MHNILSGIIEDHTHIFPVRVYYSDTDAGGIVYHSRYLDMAEHGRSEMLRSIGGTQSDVIKEQRIGIVVRSLNVDYNRPGFLDDLLRVETRITRCEALTVQFHQKIMRDETCLAELKVKAGSISLENGRPVPMPGEWRNTLKELMGESSAK
jgi:acyl-CoA thioester hydrolase